MRHVLLGAVTAVTLVALTITLTASAGSRKSHITNHGHPTGLVAPHTKAGHPSVGHFRTSRSQQQETAPGAGSDSTGASGPAKKDNLTYNGPDQRPAGDVMHSSKVYALFWDPGNTLSTAYKNLIGQYFTDVAHDSGAGNNVYSPGTQYTDSTGALSYNVTYGGALSDADAYPASGCTEPDDVQNSSSPTTVCLTDDQLQQEVENYVTNNSLPFGPSTEYFIYTPQSVGSCFPDAFADSGYDCAYDYYCAYHSAFYDGDNEYIYANMPYQVQTILNSNGANVKDECDTGQHPNGDSSGQPDAANAGDDVLSVTSHEHNESITDPTGYEWWVDNPNSAFVGYENGDLCAWSWFYGGPDGTDSGVGSGESSMSGNQAYNQTINGHHYFLQGEWSNASATTKGWSGCVWTYDHGPTIGDTNPSIDGGTGVKVGDTLTAHTGNWVGSATSYKFSWLRCNSLGASCKPITTTTVTSVAGTRGALGTAGPDSTYTVQRADWKSTIKVSVTATNAQGTSAAATSDPTDVVHGEPTSMFAPQLNGTATVGQVLTGTNVGSWNPNSSAITSYKWTIFRCNGACKVAKSGTETTPADVSYTVVPADDKSTLYFEVVATNKIGASSPADSTSTATVNGEPSGGSMQLSDTTSGTSTVTVGDTLSVNTASGAWTAHGFAVSSYTVTWQSFNGVTLKTIATATLKGKTVVPTTTTFVVPAALDRSTIQVTVTATNFAGTSASVSSSTTTVQGHPTGGTPSLTDAGGFAVNDNVTVSAGTWTAHGGTLKAYSYALYRCDNTGTTCDTHPFKTLSAKTNATVYKLTHADVGHELYVTVTVTGSNTTTSDAASSAKVGPVH